MTYFIFLQNSFLLITCLPEVTATDPLLAPQAANSQQLVHCSI
jgi:hypothetical protein